MDGDNEINPSETLAEKDSQKLRENGDDSKSFSLKVTVEEANSFCQNIPIEKKVNQNFPSLFTLDSMAFELLQTWQFSH